MMFAEPGPRCANGSGPHATLPPTRLTRAPIWEGTVWRFVLNTVICYDRGKHRLRMMAAAVRKGPTMAKAGKCGIAIPQR